MHHSATARWIDGMAQVLYRCDSGGGGLHRADRHGFAQRNETPGARLRAAMETYQTQAWPEAMRSSRRWPTPAIRRPARVAAMMARQGPLLFGQRFDVSPERLARWDLAMRGKAGVVSSVDGPHPLHSSPAEAAAGLGAGQPDTLPLVTSRGTGARTAGSQPAVLSLAAR